MKFTKGKKILLSITILIVLAIAFLGMAYINAIKNPIKTDKEFITIEIKDGEGFYSVLDQLDKEGVLGNQAFIKVYLKLNKTEAKVNAGSYDVKGDITLEELVTLVTTEDISKNQVKLTIKEGNTIDTIAEIVAASGLMTEKEFIEGIKSYPLPDYVNKNSKKKYDLEGFLYPDTYMVDKNASAQVIIKTMLNNFEKKITKLEEETGVTVERSNYEDLVIKASLVEKEAVLSEERPLVSSVINNRLNKGMKLEFCSTVNYVIGHEGKDILTYKDIQVESPYNTYKNSGLPVGAIGNPGYESLKAALKPGDDDYLFFVLLEGQGGKQHFSSTFEEHERVRIEQENKRGK